MEGNDYEDQLGPDDVQRFCHVRHPPAPLRVVAMS